MVIAHDRPRHRAQQLEYQARVAAHNEQVAKERNDKRHAIAAKIVLRLTDAVSSSVIRPGPVPEERECYDMAQELRAMAPELEQYVVQIFDAENGVD